MQRNRDIFPMDIYIYCQHKNFRWNFCNFCSQKTEGKIKLREIFNKRNVVVPLHYVFICIINRFEKISLTDEKKIEIMTYLKKIYPEKNEKKFWVKFIEKFDRNISLIEDRENIYFLLEN